MPPVSLLVLALVAVAAAPLSPALPRGDGRFRLGVARAHVDSLVAARGVAVLSSGATFLVCASDDPAVEYEHFSFYRAPHDLALLWRVTLGYRAGTSHEEFERVRSELGRRLGEPASDTSAGLGPEAATARPGAPPPAERRVVWVDLLTVVRLGGRWADEPRGAADRMLVTWTDRRLQRLVEARRGEERERR